MPFTINDFQDLVRLLDQHPEWAAELRRHVLSDQLLELPERFGRIEELLERLVEAQIRIEAAVTRLGVDVGQLKRHDLERRYRERPFDFFGRVVRRAHQRSTLSTPDP